VGGGGHVILLLNEECCGSSPYETRRSRRNTVFAMTRWKAGCDNRERRFLLGLEANSTYDNNYHILPRIRKISYYY